MKAILCGDVMRIKLFLGAGSNINQQNFYGDTALVRAIQERHNPDNHHDYIEIVRIKNFW